VVVDDPNVTYHLTSELGGKQLSCFNGAARLYMPGFTKTDDPYRHPLLLSHRLSDSRERLRYAESLAHFTVRFARPLPHLARLRDERAVSDEDERRSLELAYESARRQGSEASDWEALAKAYSGENEQLKDRLGALYEDLTDANDTVRRLAYQLKHTKGNDGSRDDSLHVHFEPQTLLDAVEFARTAFEDDLRVLQSAVDAARQSPYGRPVEVYEALRFLARLAAQLRDGPIGRNLKDVFLQDGAGLKYRQGISKASSEAIREQHRFADGQTKFCCEEHLNFGTSYDPKHCARIYFTSELDADGRLVIGHVGRHLDTPRTT
jgi:hypothetical protein